MLGWALATFVKGMKIWLRKNRLSILAEREVPQHRNCLWCDKLMINYDGYGLCCVWRGLCINQECMNEWACITFCNRARHLGVAGVNSPPPIVFALFFLLLRLVSSSRTVMMIIPLPHYTTTNFGRKMCRSHPPPPPPRWVSFSGLAQCSARHFARIVEVLLAWYGNGSGVAGCSWWGDSTCGIGQARRHGGQGVQLPPPLW